MNEETPYLTKITEPIARERLQYQAFFTLSIVAAGLTGILYSTDSQLFQRFLGRINPVIAILLVIFVGYALLSWLLSQGWLAMYKRENLASLSRRSAIAALFVSVSILVDLKIRFPEQMNILFPKSLAFYPAIGFGVEILFHVVPLVVLIISLSSAFKQVSNENILWICILIVALFEPIYQTMDMASSNQFPVWALALVGFNLYLFNLSQLYIFKRYDFISMYSFRLAYYLVWHIVWGYFRLQVLF
jgi:hypothetical protein